MRVDEPARDTYARGTHGTDRLAGYILLIDDSRDLLEALSHALVDRGYSVRTASNGAEGLEALRRDLPLLIITDLEMPVMNGRKLLEALAREPLGRDVPVIILSAFGYEWEAELMGAQGYVRKPVGIDALDEQVRRVLAKVPSAPADELH